MTKEKRRSFAMRVSQANPTELVVITFDIILTDIDDIKTAIADEDRDELTASCKHAVSAIAQLMGALSLQYPLAKDLWRLYEYGQKQIIRTQYSRDIKDVEAAEGVFSGLRTAFKEISLKDENKSVMSNTQSVFAGLTYSRGRLDEISVDPNQSNRGFLA